MCSTDIHCRLCLKVFDFYLFYLNHSSIKKDIYIIKIRYPSSTWKLNLVTMQLQVTHFISFISYYTGYQLTVYKKKTIEISPFPH